MAEARMWRVHPGEDGEVDEQALNKTLFEIGVMLRRGGGGVNLVANRRSVPENDHELPSERYTESVDVQWLARTDTRPRFEDVPPPAASAEPIEPPVAAE